MLLHQHSQHAPFNLSACHHVRREASSLLSCATSVAWTNGKNLYARSKASGPPRLLCARLAHPATRLQRDLNRGESASQWLGCGPLSSEALPLATFECPTYRPHFGPCLGASALRRFSTSSSLSSCQIRCLCFWEPRAFLTGPSCPGLKSPSSPATCPRITCHNNRTA